MMKILSGNDPKRAAAYWKAAIKILKDELGIIAYYEELKPVDLAGHGWQEKWLNQPLQIQPAGRLFEDALKIHQKKATARKRKPLQSSVA